jgi:hypothetical protein
MKGARRRSEPASHPAVERIEMVLSAAASRHPAGALPGRVRHVMTICACVTPYRSPDWIIFDTDDGVGWRRQPDELPGEEILHAPVEAGGHADPSDVLAWLEGDAPDPWGPGDGYGDMAAVRALRRWILLP